MAKTDLSAFFLVDTGAVEIDLPNGQPMMIEDKRVTVHVFGPATDRYRAATDIVEKEATKRLMNVMGSKKGKDAVDKDADARFLASITDRIEPLTDAPFDIYSEPHLKYVGDQVRAYLNDQANFFKASTTA